jgi:hypothetical protein
MGSTRIQIPTALWWCLTLWVCLSAASASEMNIPANLPSAPEIEKWAGAAFFGGHATYPFSREGKSKIVVIGFPTSGVETSEIFIFDKQSDESFSLMLNRRRLFGTVKVKEIDDSLVFSGLSPILIVPWAGVVRGMEQWRQP